jgi:hypothetical protein
MNEPLLKFLYDSKPPSTTAELWLDIATMRKHTNADGLPNTYDELEDELRLLAIGGHIANGEGGWRPVPQKVKQVPQKSLF